MRLSCEEFLGLCREAIADGSFPFKEMGLSREQAIGFVGVQMALVPVMCAAKEQQAEADALAVANTLGAG